MTSLKELSTMQALVQIKYQQQQESFTRLLAQEDRLRRSLRQLDENLNASRSSDDTSQKALGADVIWQAWVGRKKRELNIQLAQVLAVKERHIAQVRQAYGKVLVTNALLEHVKADTSQKKAQSQLDRAINSMLF